MKRFYLIVWCLITWKNITCDQTFTSKYIQERQNLIAEELKAAVGGAIILSKDEAIANDILMKYKNAELEKMFKDTHTFYFKNKFPLYVHQANSSKVFNIIKAMPKGAAIQLERANTMMLDIESMIKLTYEEHLFACFYNDTVLFHFSIDKPEVKCPKDNWIPIQELRGTGHEAILFDEHLKKFFTIDVDNEDCDMDLNQYKFDRVAVPLKSLLSYRPVREKHFLQMLQDFYEDNVRYIEIRIAMHAIYELDRLIHNASFVANMYRRLISKFIIEHSDFVGVKFIITVDRDSSFEDVRNTIEQIFKLKKEFPEMIAGFDIDGHENQGKSLIEFARYLLDVKDDLNFYFQAGETNWYGTAVDENLVDAIALKTKRVGNAYALVKHPLLMTLVKEQDIGVEVSVMSNAIHCLVKDLRNHPAATYLACGLPVLLSSGNPGLWGLDPLSHDFYVTFMAVASRHADLRLLKQLAVNSIQYSALNNNEKVNFFKEFYVSCNVFVKYIIRNYREVDIDDKL